MTITLAAVYAPIGFVSGVTGVLFREFAFTLAGAVIVSGFIALTLSPMMCSKLLSREKNETWLARTLDQRLPQPSPRLQAPPPQLAQLSRADPPHPGRRAGPDRRHVRFDPSRARAGGGPGHPAVADQDSAVGNLDYTEQATRTLFDGVRGTPEIAHIFTINGSAGVRNAFAGFLLKPWDERTKNQKQVLAELSPKFLAVPQAQVQAFSPPALPGSTGGAPMQFVIRTTGDYTTLADVAFKMQQAAQESGLFLFTDVDLKFDTPQYEFKVDADKANRIGVNMSDVGTALSTMLGGTTSICSACTAAAIRSFRRRRGVPLRSRLAHPLSGAHQKRRARAPVGGGEGLGKRSAQCADQLPAAQFRHPVRRAFPRPHARRSARFPHREIEGDFPEGYTYDFQGNSRQYEQEGNALVYVFVFALIVIYLVLAAQYESFRDPLIILIALPTALFGALLPLNIGGFLGFASINIYSQIGLVTLIGLISKHGILMVDFANRLQETHGLSRRAAIEEAAAVRLRPILMTTAAMVVGIAPLIFAHGAGAVSRFNIGVTIFFGMAIGTLFTLFVTPAVYTFLARDHAALMAKEKALGHLKEEVEVLSEGARGRSSSA